MESDDKMSKRKSKTDDEKTYEIINDFGDFSDGTGRWIKSFKRLSWNVQEPKYDIRNWTKDGEPGKGVTMNLEELRTLYELIGKELDYIDHRL